MIYISYDKAIRILALWWSYVYLSSSKVTAENENNENHKTKMIW